MKANKRILWMLIALMGMVAMVSCSNDDDDDNDSDEGVVLRGEEITNEVRDLIVGTWKSSSYPSSCKFAEHSFLWRDDVDEV